VAQGRAEHGGLRAERHLHRRVQGRHTDCPSIWVIKIKV